MSSFSLNKSNSLKSTTEIDDIFKNGQKISSDFISLHYIETVEKKLKVAFSVGKKSHKLASTRNRLKRLMKESFRINAKHLIDSDAGYNFVFVYFGSEKVHFTKVEECMKSLLLSFRKKVLS